jgi:hypothetical protein
MRVPVTTGKVVGSNPIGSTKIETSLDFSSK